MIFRKNFFVLLLFCVFCGCTLHGMKKKADDTKSTERSKKELIGKLMDKHAEELGELFGMMCVSTRDFCGDVCRDFLKFLIDRFKKHHKPKINVETFKNFLNELKDYKREYQGRRQAFRDRVENAKNIFDYLQDMGILEVTEINVGV